MAGHSIRDDHREGANAVRKRSPSIAVVLVFGAVVTVVAVALAACNSTSSDSTLDILTPEPNLPTVAFTTDVTLTGSDTETCELIFEIASEPANGTVSEVTDKPCVPGSPNTDSAVVTFTADPGVCGPGQGSFTYTTNDGSATSAPATVTVDIPCIEIGVEE
jgi:hypothetical protein